MEFKHKALLLIFGMTFFTQLVYMNAFGYLNKYHYKNKKHRHLICGFLDSIGYTTIVGTFILLFVIISTVHDINKEYYIQKDKKTNRNCEKQITPNSESPANKNECNKKLEEQYRDCHKTGTSHHIIKLLVFINRPKKVRHEKDYSHKVKKHNSTNSYNQIDIIRNSFQKMALIPIRVKFYKRHKEYMY